jgi:xylulokinase
MKNDIYLLGIDISTTSAKALIINNKGKIIASATSNIHLFTPKPLWSEQDPNEWWKGIVKSIHIAIKQANIMPEEIIAIGLTGQMHSLVVLDNKGTVLRPAILWNDQRTAAECEQITKLIGLDQIIQICGNQPLPGFTAPKILWIRNNEPTIYKLISHILLPKDYIRYLLTGDYAMDKADGSGTILFNLQTRNWSQELLDKMDLPHQWFPPTFEGPEITGSVSDLVAKITGLQKGTPVAAGGGDQAAQAIGVGVVENNKIALTLGTSGVVFVPTDKPFIEPNGRLHSFCHAIPNTWHLMGVMLSAAGSLQWYHDQFAPTTALSKLIEQSKSVPIGSEGLFFLPYLTGERTPHADPYARGAFIGLTIRHTSAHLTRAVLEGVAYGMRDNFELIKNTLRDNNKENVINLERIQIYLSGGGTKSTFWTQILANILNKELYLVNTTEGAAYGAAILAGVGVGIWESVQKACQEVIEINQLISPEPSVAADYEKLYQKFRELYPALKPYY